MSEATPLQSMTGFGLGEAVLASGTLRVELRAVNHRHLDLRVRLVGDAPDVALSIEDALRPHLGRGRVEAQVRWEAAAGGHGPLHLEAARAAYNALCTLRDEISPGEPVPITAVLRVPGVLRAGPSLEQTAGEAAATAAAARALAALTAMRVREGAALKRDLLARVGLLRAHVGWLAGERPRVLSGHRERLLARVAKLLEGTTVEVDAARLTQEVAWFAERCDIAEEITRLGSHLAELERTLETRGEMVGRKLDFLVQELGREVNTIGSKANDALLAQRVVEVKAELERVREQIQNIL
jgi:uncharacterized protein (TIGR00255 family)